MHCKGGRKKKHCECEEEEAAKGNKHRAREGRRVFVP